jgi:hypothetical protein
VPLLRKGFGALLFLDYDIQIIINKLKACSPCRFKTERSYLLTLINKNVSFLFSGRSSGLFYLAFSLEFFLSLCFSFSGLFVSHTANLSLTFHLFYTFALHVNTTALVTELELALTRHMVTALILFHPKLALGTLFEFFAFNKCNKLLILLTGGGRNFILLAGHFLVPLYAAIEAVLFFAFQTLEALSVLFLEEEHVAARRGRAPRAEYLYEYIESPFISA